MGDSNDTGGNREPLSSVSPSGKGSKNKRKYLTEFLPDKINMSSLTEFPRYELLEEKLRNISNEVGLVQGSDSSSAHKEQEVDEWNDPIVPQLQVLLSDNLHQTLKRAIQKMVERGYNKEIAEQTFLRCGLYHSTKDTVSNAVDGALIFMNREKELETSKCDVFSDFDKLVDYTIIEMVSVLKEVRPGITVAEAMWVLLICDVNLLHACVANGNHLSGISLQDMLEETPFGTVPSRLKPEATEPIHACLKNVHFAKSVALGSQSSNSKDLTVRAPTQVSSSKDSQAHEVTIKGKESSDPIGKSTGTSREHILNVSQGPNTEEKSVVCRKGLFVSSKREMLRQKPFHLEKNYKGRPRGAFKTKVTWSSMGLDKPLKLPGSSGIVMKGPFPKITPSVGANCPIHEGNSSVSNIPASVTQPTDASVALTSKGAVFALPAVHAKNPVPSDLESEPTLNTSSENSGSSTSSEVLDCCDGIPYDESLGKFVPQDEKEESILTLVSHLKALQKEIQGWNEWANEKVMQATRRLSKDQAEMKMLKQEKEETEKLKNDKQGPDDSSLKRISEIDYAIRNATKQIEIANSTVRSLEKENSVLQAKLDAARERAFGATKNLEEALLREQEAFKRSQAMDKMKIILKEELTTLKRQAADLRRQLERAEERKNQLEVLWRQEEREQQKYLSQTEDIRKLTERQKAKSKAEEDCMRETAESNSQSHNQYIKKLEDEISQLRLLSESSKIAALLGGFDMNYGTSLLGSKMASAWLEPQAPKVNKRLAVFQDNFEEGSVKPERECVMCLTEEMSVVFFPCAHQVLCGECNVRHEKQGMKDCPSCRTPIQERINVRFEDS